MIRDLEFIECGTGTSAGVPVIGCDCPTCSSNDPHDHRTRCGACIRFTDAGGQARVILIDCPPDHRAHALGLGLQRCDLILMTHDHVDHVFGLDEVRRYNAIMKTPIELRADQPTLDSLDRIFKHVFQKQDNVNVSFVADIMPRPLSPLEPIDRFGLRFEPLPIMHGRLGIFGFRIDALGEDGGVAEQQPDPLPLGYLTDCSGIPPETWPRLTGLKTLFLDMLRYRAHPTHFTVEKAVEVAEQIAAQETWFVHMTHDIRHAELDPELPVGMRLAWDGLALPGAGTQPVTCRAAEGDVGG